MEKRDNTGNSRNNKSIVSEGNNQTELNKLSKDEKIKKILSEADARTIKQRSIFTESEFVSGTKAPILEPFALSKAELQNPDLAHNLYYKKYRALLRKYTPAGKEGAPIRSECNNYLKEGKKTGRDGRQAYTKVIQATVNHIIEWVNAEGSLMELWEKFKDLNDKNVEITPLKPKPQKQNTKKLKKTKA